MRKTIVVVAFLLAGCGSTIKPTEIPITPNVQVQVECKAVDYGNGVLYFSCKEEDFGWSLSTYLGSHPKKKVVSVAADDTYAYGTTRGYFVVVEDK